jgi:predicted DNA-binding antitoxin AbrB/MazE fold protein
MTQEFHAIYEHGVLRPLTPLNLPESTEVMGVLQEKDADAGATSQMDAAELKRQQDALNAMFREVDTLPQRPCNDGLSGRDHDQILYGSRK